MKNTIRVERAKLDISQEVLAKHIGVSRQTIISIEAGKYTSGKTAMKIADFFKTRLEDIFTLELNEMPIEWGKKQ